MRIQNSSMKNATVLLIKPSSRSQQIYGELMESAGLFPPLGLAYVASLLEKKNVHVEILDMDANPMSILEFKQYLMNTNPTVVGVQSATPLHNNAMEYLKCTKENSDAITLIGGPHASALPEQVAENEYVDFVVRGEGEYSSLKLIEAIRENQHDFSKIDGIAYRDKSNKVILTKESKPIEDLDSLPFPAFEKLPINRYKVWVAQDEGRRIMTMLSSRGCPFGCIYCCKAVSGRIWRGRSPENVLEEISYLIKDFNIEEIVFFDDTFTLNRNRVISVCEGIIKRKMEIVWNIFTRVDKIDKELLILMKRAGLISISFGLESGDDRILKNLNKGTTVEQGYKAVKWCREVGILTRNSFMIGSPGETPETIEKTIRLAKYCGYSSLDLLTVFPGTKHWQMAIEQGLIDGKGEILGDKRLAYPTCELSKIQLGAPYFIPENMTLQKLLNFKKEADRRLFLNLNFIIHHLLQLNSWRHLVRTIKAGAGVLKEIFSR